MSGNYSNNYVNCSPLRFNKIFLLYTARSVALSWMYSKGRLWKDVYGSCYRISNSNLKGSQRGFTMYRNQNNNESSVVVFYHDTHVIWKLCLLAISLRVSRQLQIVLDTVFFRHSEPIIVWLIENVVRFSEIVTLNNHKRWKALIQYPYRIKYTG